MQSSENLSGCKPFITTLSDVFITPDYCVEIWWNSLLVHQMFLKAISNQDKAQLYLLHICNKDIYIYTYIYVIDFK